MEKIEWDDGLSVGIELIDEQHKKWMQHLNDISAAIESRQGPGRITNTLGFLVDYTDYHFSTEEKHMSANDYPQIKDHKAKHQQLRAALQRLVEDFEEEGATHILADSVNTFLTHWLINHIKEVDMRLGAFLKEKGVAIAAES